MRGVSTAKRYAGRGVRRKWYAEGRRKWRRGVRGRRGARRREASTAKRCTEVRGGRKGGKEVRSAASTARRCAEVHGDESGGGVRRSGARSETKEEE